MVLGNSLFAQELKPIITQYLTEKKASLKLDEKDSIEWIFSDQYTDASNGFTYAYLQQTFQGVPVFNAISAVVIRNNQVVNFTSGFRSGVSVSTITPSLSPLQAIYAAASHLGIFPSAPILIEQTINANKYQYKDLSISEENITVTLCIQQATKGFHLAWDVSIALKDHQHWWNVRVDAGTGEYLEKNDWTTSCDFSPEQLQNYTNTNSESTASDFLMPIPPLPGSGTEQYSVFHLPVESPNHGNRIQLGDISDVQASPFGWHDTNGSAGGEFTITRGNNVYAYEDANNDNLPGYSPNGGALYQFNYPYHKDSTTTYNRDASITNLFYLNNIIHDIFYHLGFTEGAGNFQSNNYSNTGSGNDYVLAEGFDGGGTNNANFNTPPDGISGRMQMYLWPGSTASCSNIVINSPASIAGTQTSGIANFGPQPTSPLSANAVIAIDGTSPAGDGCQVITNTSTMAGKIAIIDRGNCNFNVKVQNAQNAGAVAVIIVDNVISSTPPAMTGTTGSITIPVMSVTNAVGNSIKARLNANEVVNITLNFCTMLIQARDGSFDNGIVIHEYGHGISNRLTGGPSNTSCLSNAEQGGEGWSDYLGLVLTMKAGDTGGMARGIGTYAIGQPITGAGIRRYPYSTNMSINPQTYSHLALSSEVHNVGEIWCDVLWDMTWLLITQHGFNADLYNGTGGNAIALRLVIEGMKLQPCNPGFLDARDAILSADDLLYSGIHRCLIWQAFAGRGMGWNANQGSTNVAGDETQDFTLPPFCMVATTPPTANFIATTTTVTCPASVQFTDLSTNTPQAWLWDFGDNTTSTLRQPVHNYAAPGTYTVKLKVTNTLGADSLIRSAYISVNTFPVTTTVSAPSACLGDSLLLTAIPSGSNAISSYTLTSIPYAPLSGTGTTVSLSDDQVSSALSIGFNFNFYGNIYSTFYISSNGFISFGPSANGCCAGQLLPGTSTPNNLIALGWNDLNPGVNASNINYFTTGISPNQKLVVSYTTNHYGGTAYPFIFQAILSEGSNEIEIHTTSITNASAFDPAGYTTQGIENADGTKAVTVPGRNAAHFSAANDAYRFTPYAVFNYAWSPASGLNQPTSSITKASPPITTTYQVSVTDANGCIGNAAPVTVNITNCILNLNLKACIEGYYAGGGTMLPVLKNQGINNDSTITDTIRIELRDQFSPGTVIATAKGVLSTSCNATFTFPAALSGSSYYVVLIHRNALQTWSASPIMLSANTNYDFTNMATKAYSSNMKQMEPGVWALFSGDASPQDEFIDVFDASIVDNDAQVFSFGYYSTDINGDGFVDVFDASIIDNNGQLFVFSAHP